MNPLTWIKIGLGVLSLLTLVGGGWFIVDRIQQTQKLKDQNAQLVQLQKDAQELKEKQAKLEDINSDILLKLGERNARVVERSNEVTRYIQSPEGQKSNRPSSDVIKKTIGMLRDED